MPGTAEGGHCSDGENVLVLHVERVSGRYIEPEIIDCYNGSQIRIHEDDVGEDGAAWLDQAFTDTTKLWTLRPPSTRPGPIVPVRFECVADLPEQFAIVIDDTPESITYSLDEKSGILTQRAADTLSRLATQRTPRWCRYPQGYREKLAGAR
ncbi:hypothetical protein ACIHCX_03055 [Streptomyces sp. NPDC052043]|uniref:hypothetical protein n=1 Tax=Streptomyces sp. NPDC052043 TaxID=3365684 RepID=UPI0037D4A829